MKRFLLTALGAAMIILSGYLAFEKKVGILISVLPLVIAFLTIIAMCLLPKAKPVSILEKFASLNSFDLQITLWGVIICVAALLIFPKGIIVFALCFGGIGVVLLYLMLKLASHTGKQNA